MGARVVLSLCLAALAGIDPQPQTRQDFSGSWTFDRVKSAEPWRDGRIVIAAILGDPCVATQDATSLRLSMTVGADKVMAVYNFEGESRNTSPGAQGQAGIPVTSRASWDGDTLVIVSTSASMVEGQNVTVETRRVMRLDRDGNLTIERTGTPASEVTPSRSVYTRVR
jgi:hypothetical protein